METVTVTENGIPAVALDGAVKLRIACGVAQPSVIENAIAIVSTQTLRAGAALVAARQNAVGIVNMEATARTGIWHRKDQAEPSKLSSETGRLGATLKSADGVYPNGHRFQTSVRKR